MQPNFTITTQAIYHFLNLIKQEGDDVALRIGVVEPMTPNADVIIAFCQDDPAVMQNEHLFNFPDFNVFVPQESLPYLEEAYIDLHEDELTTELIVKAPNLRPSVDQNLSLQQQIEVVITNSINPMLASHNGKVELSHIDNDNRVFLVFGGGCQGCQMSKITLKNAVEKILLQQCPTISAIIDATAHEEGLNPYY